MTKGQTGLADFNDIDAFSQLSWLFQQEEYGDRFKHNLDYLRTHVAF